MAAIPGTIFQLLVIEGKVICGWENDFVAYVARYPQAITEVENALKYAVNQLRALSAPQAQA